MLDLINTPREDSFDAVVSLACAVFKVPVALISFLDEHVQWFKAASGTRLCSTEREVAFCNHTVALGNVVVVTDASLDPRFATNRLVTDEGIRFYAGAPLSLDPGVHLGTLCIIGHEPRAFSEPETQQLRQMADIVNALLRQHRDARALGALASDLDAKARLAEKNAEALARSKRLFDRASELSLMGAWEWYPSSGELTWTEGMYDIHELPRGSVVSAETVQSFYPEESRKQVQDLLSQARLTHTRYTFEGPMRTAKGRKRWIRLMGDVEIEDGAVVRCFGVKQDITEQKTTFNKMQYLAEFDTLTGLPNRTIFQRKLQRIVKSIGADQQHVPYALLLIDLDGFKTINDSFGHAVGDECLTQIAKRLRRIPEDTEILARMGGDEFALLLDATSGATSIEQRVETVLHELRRPIRWAGQSFQLSGSVGVAYLGGDAGFETELVTQADLALYAAKTSGRNMFRVFTPDMKRRADMRFKTVRDITKALAQNQLELFYQPKVRLSADVLAGFEALLRWRRSDGQIVSANSFSAALEDPELSDRIGEWVIMEALSQAREWHRAGLDFGHIAINLSAGQFRDLKFGERLIDSIAKFGLKPEMIEVEVTEGVFLSQEAGAVKILETLRAAGVRIALDDFGTGFASLTHLRTYPVDIIKIDRSFVLHFLKSTQDHAILQSTLFLARHLRLDVVAEGIEELEQCEFLKALGCKFGQGWYFSKAISAAEAAEWCLPIAHRSMAG